jgi:hypothetical protein
MRAGLVGRPRAKSTGYQRPCRTKAVNGQGRWYDWLNPYLSVMVGRVAAIRGSTVEWMAGTDIGP